MTADAFTEAARAEAESWIGMDLDDHDNFVSGAEWARAHLAAQEPADMGDLVAVSWTDCDCEWETKYCDENHRRMTRIPRSALTRAARRDEEHVHAWRWKQNTTSRGFPMPPIEVCPCGAARDARRDEEAH